MGPWCFERNHCDVRERAEACPRTTSELSLRREDGTERARSSEQRHGTCVAIRLSPTTRSKEGALEGGAIAVYNQLRVE
jgi:hypothetical protein